VQNKLADRRAEVRSSDKLGGSLEPMTSIDVFTHNITNESMRH